MCSEIGVVVQRLQIRLGNDRLQSEFGNGQCYRTCRVSCRNRSTTCGGGSTLVQWWEQGSLMGERQGASGTKGAKASFMIKRKRESCLLGPFHESGMLLAFPHVASLNFYILLPRFNFIICILQVKIGSERLSPFPKVTRTPLGRISRTWTLDCLSLKMRLFSKNKASDYNNEVFLGVVMPEENGEYTNVYHKLWCICASHLIDLSPEQFYLELYPKIFNYESKYQRVLLCKTIFHRNYK